MFDVPLEVKGGGVSLNEIENSVSSHRLTTPAYSGWGGRAGKLMGDKTYLSPPP